MAKRGRGRPKKITMIEKAQSFFVGIIPQRKNINYTKLGIQLSLFLFASLFSVFTVLYVVRFFSIEAPGFSLPAMSDLTESESQKVSIEERQLVLYNGEDVIVDGEEASNITDENITDENLAVETTTVETTTVETITVEATDTYTQENSILTPPKETTTIILPETSETIIRDMYFGLRYGMYDIYVEKFSDRIRKSFTFKTYFNQERMLGFVQATNNTLAVSSISKEDKIIRYTLSYTYDGQQYSEQWRVQLDQNNKIDLINCDNDGCSFMPFFKYIQG